MQVQLSVKRKSQEKLLDEHLQISSYGQIPQGCCTPLPSCTGTGAFQCHVLSWYSNNRWLDSFQQNDKTGKQEKSLEP